VVSIRGLYQKKLVLIFLLNLHTADGCYALARREGGNKRCFYPSVHPPCTQRTIWEPKGLACWNFEGRFPTFYATSIPVSRSKGQRSRSPGPLMLTHIVPISSERQGLRTSKSVYGWRTTTHISYRRHDLQGQRSLSQGHVISLSSLGPTVYLCH